MLFISKPPHTTNKQTKKQHCPLVAISWQQQWETKYRTKKLTLNVALSFFSFALGVDHTPWWKKNYTFSAQCRSSCSKATDWEQVTKQQWSNLEVKRLVVTMVKDLLNQVWVCVKRYIILTLSEFKTKLNKNHLAKTSIDMDGRCCSTLKFEKWNVIC